MKGVIVEIKKGQAIVLSEDGSLTQVRNRGHQIGEVIPMKQQSNKRSSVSRKFAAMAASIAALLLVGGGSAWAYATPYSYVSLDVNPSITYTVNMFDRVIDYQVNDDANEMLSKGAIQLKNMDVDDAVKATIKEMAKQGYLQDLKSNVITITAASSNDEKSAELIAALKEKIADVAEEQGITDADIEAEAIGLERVELARQLSEEYSTNGAIVMVSPGKLNLVQKMIEASSSESAIRIGENNEYDTMEEWLENASVKDIMKATKEFKEAQRALLKQDREADQDDDEVQNVSTSAIQNQNKPDDDDEDKNTTASAIKNGKGNTEHRGNKGGNPSGAAIDDDDDSEDDDKNEDDEAGNN